MPLEMDAGLTNQLLQACAMQVSRTRYLPNGFTSDDMTQELALRTLQRAQRKPDSFFEREVNPVRFFRAAASFSQKDVRAKEFWRRPEKARGTVSLEDEVCDTNTTTPIKEQLQEALLSVWPEQRLMVFLIHGFSLPREQVWECSSVPYLAVSVAVGRRRAKEECATAYTVFTAVQNGNPQPFFRGTAEEAAAHFQTGILVGSDFSWRDLKSAEEKDKETEMQNFASIPGTPMPGGMPVPPPPPTPGVAHHPGVPPVPQQQAMPPGFGGPVPGISAPPQPPVPPASMPQQPVAPPAGMPGWPTSAVPQSTVPAPPAPGFATPPVAAPPQAPTVPSASPGQALGASCVAGGYITQAKLDLFLKRADNPEDLLKKLKGKLKRDGIPMNGDKLQHADVATWVRAWVAAGQPSAELDSIQGTAAYAEAKKKHGEAAALQSLAGTAVAVASQQPAPAATVVAATPQPTVTRTRKTHTFGVAWRRGVFQQDPAGTRPQLQLQASNIEATSVAEAIDVWWAAMVKAHALDVRNFDVENRLFYGFPVVVTQSTLGTLLPVTPNDGGPSYLAAPSPDAEFEEEIVAVPQEQVQPAQETEVQQWQPDQTKSAVSPQSADLGSHQLSVEALRNQLATFAESLVQLLDALRSQAALLAQLPHSLAPTTQSPSGTSSKPRRGRAAAADANSTESAPRRGRQPTSKKERSRKK